MNRIIIERKIDGFTIVAVATYLPSADGWNCSVRAGYRPSSKLTGRAIEERGPDKNDVWATLRDMIDLALEKTRQRTAENRIAEEEIHEKELANSQFGKGA